MRLGVTRNSRGKTMEAMLLRRAAYRYGYIVCKLSWEGDLAGIWIAFPRRGFADTKADHKVLRPRRDPEIHPDFLP